MEHQKQGHIGAQVELAEGPEPMTLDRWADLYVRLVMELDREGQLGEVEELDAAA